MATGFFTQGVAILFEQAPLAPAMAQALAPFAASPHEGTEQNFFETSWILPLAPGSSGVIMVDTLPRPWPDSFGNPENDALVYLAWGAGAFGPGAFPGGLQRAADGAPEAEVRSRRERHRCVVRVRVTYALGRDPADTSPLFPAGRDAIVELQRTLQIAAALLILPGALAFFNPSAELLASPDAFFRALAASRGKPLPWPLLISIRNLPMEGGRRVLDSLGLASQFAHASPTLRDHELLLEDGQAEGAAAFLRGLCAGAVLQGHDWQPGDRVDGPGGVWAPVAHEEALLVPPRPVWRWLPEAQVGREPGAGQGG
ncbi:MAG: hypothetical protein MUF64_12690 [Polyangiaceae bacterium]|jgi:hypothetical protein|nr:hypothetical protein [Polyangiaceae bacterium]